MKIAMIGGDRRAAILSGLLLREGERLQSYALERAGLPEEIPRAEHLPAALYGADAVILPLPVERGGLLNAPYARLPCAMEELFDALWPGQLVFGGMFSGGGFRTAEACSVQTATSVVDIQRVGQATSWTANDWAAGNVTLIDANDVAVKDVAFVYLATTTVDGEKVEKVLSVGDELSTAATDGKTWDLGDETITIKVEKV